MNNRPLGLLNSGSNEICEIANEDCSVLRTVATPTKPLESRANSVTSASKPRVKVTGTASETSSISPSKLLKNVTKMHAECGFEQLCVDSKIVPEIINRFAVIRRITLFVRGIVSKDSNNSYLFACLVCSNSNIYDWFY